MRPDPGRAGRSAQREHDRRASNRRATVLARHPVVGRWWLAVTGEPATTRSWAAGAMGERVVGGRLDALAGRGVVTLHDRRVPGRRGNLDHVAVGPAGVFVVDAKQLHGARVSVRRATGLLVPGPARLRIAGRDRTAMVDAMAWQVAAVQRALATLSGNRAEPGPRVVRVPPVQPVLALVAGRWPATAGVVHLGDVCVVRPRHLARVVGRAGPLAPGDVLRVATHLSQALPPA